MPIYEYRRPDGSTFEVVQSFSDEPLTHDPETGVEVRRVLHAPAVHFKGKGFYNTDYGTRKRQRESAASTAEESSGSADGSSPKGDSKSADGGAGKEGSGKEGSGAGGDGAKRAEKSSKPDAGSAKRSEPAAAKS